MCETEVEEVRAALYLLFWAVTVADGGGLAALGDGDGVVGDFRAADTCWPPAVDDAQRVCTSVVSAWLTRTGSCQALAGRGAAQDLARSASALHKQLRANLLASCSGRPI